MKSKIYFLLLAVGCLLACKKDELVPIVSIDPSSSDLEVSYTKATVQWDIENGISVSEVIAEYTEDSTFSEFSQVSMTQATNRSSSKDVVSYKTTLTHLKEKTVYYLRYHVFNKYTSNTSGHFSFTTKVRHTPNVQTENVTDVSYTTAKLHAQLLDWGTDTIPQVGFCLANHPNVSINDSCVKCNISTSTNAYSIILSSLKDSTKYYIRAYAKNSKGTAYGKEKSFTTKAFSTPVVTTSSVTNVTEYNAICGGNVTDDGGLTVIERGICYSTTEDPTINDMKVEGGAGTGKFTCSLSDLPPGTVFYARAYAVNSKGITYGDEKSFTTLVEPSIIRYTSEQKIAETTSSYDSGIHTNAFGDAYISSHTFNGGQGIIVFSGKLISIGENAFRECTGMTSIELPEGLISIGENAFIKCSSLISIEIPNGVTSIGDYAFLSCSSLTSVTIPTSVQNIGKSAFSSCSSLTLVTIPNGVTSIGNYAFSSCSSLTSVTIPNGVTSIGQYAFSSCQNLVSIELPYSITTLETHIFSNCQKLTSIEIPNSVTSIGNFAFLQCSSLTSVIIPTSVQIIGKGAFSDCSSLTSVTIPNSVISIGERAFSRCGSLISVTIPNSVTSIGDWAFEDCRGLTSVTIGNSVTSIGRGAFYNCSGLTSITCNATTPPTCGSSAFYGVTKSIPVYVPASSVDAYRAKTGWSDFTNIQPL